MWAWVRNITIGMIYTRLFTLIVGKSTLEFTPLQFLIFFIGVILLAFIIMKAEDEIRNDTK